MFYVSGGAPFDGLRYITGGSITMKIRPEAPNIQVDNVNPQPGQGDELDRLTGVLGGVLAEDDYSRAGSAYGLVVDGSKMYNPTTGKIVADGYIDLQPPADNETQTYISGYAMPEVGWVSVDGKTT